MRADFPTSVQAAQNDITNLRQRLASLKRGQDSLRERKELTERMAFYRNATDLLTGLPYLLPGEAVKKSAAFEISHVAFGDVHLLNCPGELFSTVCAGLETGAGEPVVATSFADGVSGYLLPAGDFKEGGYAWTWGLFTPEPMADMRRAALRLLRQN